MNRPPESRRGAPRDGCSPDLLYTHRRVSPLILQHLQRLLACMHDKQKRRRVPIPISYSVFFSEEYEVTVHPSN